LKEESGLRVNENSVQRRIFGFERDELRGKWRKQYNDELNDLYCSTNIVRMIKSRSMRGHKWQVILIWVFRNYNMGVWTGSSCLRMVTGDGHMRLR
jgi:hypothetical protein